MKIKVIIKKSIKANSKNKLFFYLKLYNFFFCCGFSISLNKRLFVTSILYSEIKNNFFFIFFYLLFVFYKLKKWEISNIKQLFQVKKVK